MKTSTLGMDLGGTRLLLCCDEIEENYSTGISFTPVRLLQLLESFIERMSCVWDVLAWLCRA